MFDVLLWTIESTNNFFRPFYGLGIWIPSTVGADLVSHGYHMLAIRLNHHYSAASGVQMHRIIIDRRSSFDRFEYVHIISIIFVYIYMFIYYFFICLLIHIAI